MWLKLNTIHPRHLLIMLGVLSMASVIFLSSLFMEIADRLNAELEKFSTYELKEAENISSLALKIFSSHEQLVELLLYNTDDEGHIYESGIQIIDRIRDIEKLTLTLKEQPYINQDESVAYLALYEHLQQYRQATQWAIEASTVNIAETKNVLNTINSHLISTLNQLNYIENAIFEETEESFMGVATAVNNNLRLFIPSAIFVVLMFFVLGLYTYYLNRRLTDSVNNQNIELNKKVIEKTHELVLANKELAVLNRVKSDFLTRMSHEFRTPMNAIMGFNQLSMMDNDISLEQKNYAGEINNACHEMLAMIDNILQFGQSQHRVLDMNIEEILLDELIKDSISTVRKKARESHINLQADLEKNVYTVADRYYLKLVINHLLDNAIKYNRDNGSITVKTRLEEETVKILVIDTGAGIKQENFNKIFEPFYKMDTPSKVVEGTGVGLSLCKNVLTQMNASISVQSKINEGSTFIITLKTVQPGTAPG